jgi:hypothetical protein
MAKECLVREIMPRLQVRPLKPEDFELPGFKLSRIALSRAIRLLTPRAMVSRHSCAALHSLSRDLPIATCSVSASRTFGSRSWRSVKGIVVPRSLFYSRSRRACPTNRRGRGAPSDIGPRRTRTQRVGRHVATFHGDPKRSTSSQRPRPQAHASAGNAQRRT